MSVSLCGDQISDRSFWIISREAKSWHSQHIVNNIFHGECGIDLVLGCVSWLRPGILLLTNDFEVAGKSTDLARPRSQRLHVHPDVSATAWESFDVRSSIGDDVPWTQHVHAILLGRSKGGRHALLSLMHACLDSCQESL